MPSSAMSVLFNVGASPILHYMGVLKKVYLNPRAASLILLS